MNKRALLGAILMFSVTGAAWAQGGPPQPAPEHKRLAYYTGTWNFTGETKASPMGPGGPMTFTETCQMMEGGFALVCHAKGKSPMGPTEAHAIMSYDPEKKAYTYTAAESNMPVIHALGTVTGATWTWTTESDMGGKLLKTRVIITEEAPKGYDFKMEMAVGDSAYTTVAEGKATRAGS